MQERARILIIDDDLSARESLKDNLELEGYLVETAANGSEALQKARGCFQNILLIDILLPDIRGSELLTQLKHLYPESEAIMVTGYASLESALDTFEQASAYIQKPIQVPQLLEKVESLLRKQTTRLKQKEDLELYRELSHLDALTRLHNARHFRDLFDVELQRAERYGHTLAVIMLDIDHFKQYNDRYGHLEGDAALTGLARILQEVPRVSDVAARVGGEEFAILLPETDKKNAYLLAERLRTAVEETEFPLHDGTVAHLTLSLGIAEYPKDASSETDLLRCADQALYTAKNNGRNQTRLYSYDEESTYD